MTRTVSFTPAVLAIAPRPLERELTSSWMERVAAANLVSLRGTSGGIGRTLSRIAVFPRSMPGPQAAARLEPGAGRVVSRGRAADPCA